MNLSFKEGLLGIILVIREKVAEMSASLLLNEV